MLGASADVLAPCALGGVLSRDTVPAIRCGIICGAANNILAEQSVAKMLHDARITYVPDFLSNSGATVWGALTHIEGPGDYTERVAAIEERTANLIEMSRSAGRPPLEMALERLQPLIGTVDG